MHRCLARFAMLWLLVAAWSARPAVAAEGAAKYPHVNMAAGYQADPSWPQRPDHCQWEAVSGLAVDARDNVYVFTRGKPPVQVYDRQGKFLRGWGADAIATPHVLRLDAAGNVWVTDVGNHVVMQFTPEGKLLRTLGTRGEPGCDATHMNKPTDMAVTPDGEVFVSDGYGNARIVHFDAKGKFVKAWGKLGTGPGEFSLPHGICRDSQGRLYVADRNNARVQVFTADGKFLDEWRNLLVPWGFCITKQDEILVCGSSPMTWLPEQENLGCPPKDQVIMRFNPAGKLLQLWTLPLGAEGATKPGEVSWLHTLAVDSQGNLYVGDIMGKRAQKLVPIK